MASRKRVNLVFVLSMPSNNAWNGKWSGYDEYYAEVRTFKSEKEKVRAEEILKRTYYRYSFGDGWVAGISVRQVPSDEVRKIRKKSKGFCGYGWMVDSIKEHLEIKVAEKHLPRE